jgi:hypothetical protein
MHVIFQLAIIVIFTGLAITEYFTAAHSPLEAG